MKEENKQVLVEYILKHDTGFSEKDLVTFSHTDLVILKVRIELEQNKKTRT